MNIIIEAAQYAALAHFGQQRKYNGDPYFFHLERVANRAIQIPGITEIIVASCYLHDIWEDQPNFWPLPDRFPPEVSSIVSQLTNPSKEFKMLSRAEQKAMDREHLHRVTREAKIIKYLDRMDNLRDMTGASTSFKTTYLRESRLLAEALKVPETATSDHFRAVLSNLNYGLNQLIDQLSAEYRIAA